MAGSGSRPLPNIPYCCLPQESGPCLSTSVGDRPLRSPSHRRLGGPSPRRLSNGTHARPRPPELSPPGDAPVRPHGALPGVSTGCAPVGGWLHTRCAPVRHSRRPEGRLPFDLHVLGLPLAFILSQDQTLRCSIAVLLNYSESRVPLLSAHHCAGVSLASFSLRPASPKEHRPQCWPQTLNELCAPPKHLSALASSLGKAGAKVALLQIPTMGFFKYFSISTYLAGCQYEEILSRRNFREKYTLLMYGMFTNAAKRHPRYGQ